jgi:SAM-dependent methyltransferase
VSRRTECRICGSAATASFVRREQVPVHQNLVMSDSASARAIGRGTLDMHACSRCGFVFNAEFDPDKLAYGAGYDNTQECSTVFERHLDDLARHLVEDCGVRNSSIVEVGCGKGTFLRKLVAYPDSGNRGYGYDPSFVGPESELDGRLTFYRRYYGRDCTDAKADVIVCRHVIEHVAEPLTLLRGVRASARSDASKVFFETPCVAWILDNEVLWDFFYEHCSLFTSASLAAAFEHAGFSVDLVRHVFGGQYLWLEATPRSGGAAYTCTPGDIPALASRYAAAEHVLVGRWRRHIEGVSHTSGIAIWGAGAKGSTFANLVDPTAELIRCVVDINPKKQGAFIPGSGHPIVDYHVLPRLGVTEIVLMNENYRAENAALLAAAGIHAQFTDLDAT